MQLLARCQCMHAGWQTANVSFYPSLVLLLCDLMCCVSQSHLQRHARKIDETRVRITDQERQDRAAQLQRTMKLLVRISGASTALASTAFWILYSSCAVGDVFTDSCEAILPAQRPLPLTVTAC